MKKKRDPLEAFVERPKPRDRAKPNYVMVRFTKKPHLIDFAIERAMALGISREAYILALIERDKSEVGS